MASEAGSALNVLRLHPEIEVVGEAENSEEAARLRIAGEAAIALLDIEMPRMGGLTAADVAREPLAVCGAP